MTGLSRFLHDNKPATIGDGDQAGAAIRTRSGQHDACRAVLEVFRQRKQQEIEWKPDGPLGWGPCDVQRALRDGQKRTRCDDVDMVGFDRHAVRRLTNGQGRMTREQIGQQAFVHGIQVLDNNVGHARVG